MQDNSNRQITFFGTGTSHGVPVMLCHCPVCRSSDARDKRMRSSALYSQDGTNILIDCGPDFRTQFLRSGVDHIDALLLTHIHYDHVGGLDDLRPFSYKNGFDVYASADVIDQLRRRSPYLFTGSSYKGLPNLRFHAVLPGLPFSVNNVEIEPFTVMHGSMPILAYKTDCLAYITDASEVPEHALALLKHIPTLVINSLRHTEHPAHMNLCQTLSVIKETEAKRAYLTHMSHEMGRHSELQSKLPPNVFPAYDGLTVEL